MALRLLSLLDDHSDVARALVDAERAAHRTRADALDRRALVHVRLGDVQRLGLDVVLLLSVGCRAVHDLADDLRGTARGELEDRLGVRDRLAPDEVDDLARLARAHP